MNEQEPTVQVPVSLPTRGQIAEALFRVDHGPDARWERTQQAHAEYLTYADAMLALLSQPTPTADRIEDVMQRNWDRRYGAAEPPRDARSAMERESDALDELRNTPVPTTEPDGDESGWPEPHDLPPEPPRIEDLAPGTTFTGQYRAGAFLGGASRWLRDSHGVALASTGLRISPRDIDPSTIRDVTPPKDAA